MPQLVALREQIDGLATRLVLDGPGSGMAADLARLSEMAASQGCDEAASIAADLAQRAALRIRGKKKQAELSDALQSGISRLQQALANEERRADAPERSSNTSQKSAAPEPPRAPVPLSQDPELVANFVMESREHLTAIENNMLVLEQNPSSADAIHTVFRAFHTIKGLAGFLEYPIVQEVAHEVETLLDLARNGKLAIASAVVDVVLEGADFLKMSVDAIEASMAGRESKSAGDHAPLLSRLKKIMSGEVALPKIDTPKPEAEAAAAEPAPEPAKTAARAAETFSIRVETGKLDYLMDMVGGMVIAQSLIRHNPAMSTVQDTRLQGDLAQLARITAEVQRTAMGMRMLPIGQLFQRTARLVRDLSRKAGKQVQLDTSGEDTELDKTIAEELADPLMHMVRNSLDHGIEPPDERIAAGKDPLAHVRLSAYHRGGQIVVEIADDGRGLDREKILRKARSKGLVAEGVTPSDNEIFHLIFEPGFSTADQVTDISGRGVGMDVVRKAVQKLRGRIDIESTPGQGATFFLKLPLTLAIIEGLVVVVGGYRYILPIYSVKEMFRPSSDALSTVQGRDEMAMVRGNLLPIVRLHQRFGVQPKSTNPCEGLLVVAECEGKQFCVLVDDVVGKQEVVIKSLGESLKNIAGIAGGAILGDGRVGLILDVDGVFRGAARE